MHHVVWLYDFYSEACNVESNLALSSRDFYLVLFSTVVISLGKRKLALV